MNTLKNDRCGYTNLLNSAIKELLTYPPDITIFAQDGKLEVNRLVFSMYSPTLNAAISHWFPSSSLLLPDYSIASVRILVDLLETGFSARQDLPVQHFQNVLEIANHLRIQLDNNNVQAIENEVYSEQKNDLATKTSETKHGAGFKIGGGNTSLPNDITKPKVKQSRESSIDEVTCKGSKGEFHHKDKLISGENEFEKLSGSKANKYQQSLRVNGKPLKVIDPHGPRQATPPVQLRQSVNLIKGKSRMNSARIPQLSNLAKSERSDPTSKLWKQEEDSLFNKKYQKNGFNPMREENVNAEKNIHQDTTQKSNVRNENPIFTETNPTMNNEYEAGLRPIADSTSDEEIDFVRHVAVKDNSANIDDSFAENSVMKNNIPNIDQTNNELIGSKASFDLKSKLPKATSQTKQLKADATSNDFTKPKLKQSDENSIYEVICKESVGEFHQDKYISGGKGLCIFFKEIWLTPNEFERMAGSRSKKYKESLKVNGKPIRNLIDPSGARPTTPSIQQKPSDNLKNSKPSKISQRNLVKSESVQGNQQRQSASLKRGDAQINSTRIPQFSKVNQSKGSTSKLRKPENKENYINPPRDESNKKRKKTFNKGNDMRNTNSKKIQLDKMHESNVKDAHILSVGTSSTLERDWDEFMNTGDDITSDNEIDLSGTPVFMALQDNAASLDESYMETILMQERTSNMDESYTEDAVMIDLNCLDNYGSPILSKTKIKQINDNDVAEMVDLGQFEKRNSSNESTDVGQFDTTKLDDKFPKPDVKKENGRFSEGQTSGLRKAFNENNFLSKETAYTLSQELCLTEKQIKAWFNNSRAKEKMKVKDEMEHPDKEAASASVKNNFLEENRKYSCEFCPRSFVNKSKLIQHMSSHDSGTFQNDKTHGSDGTNIGDETQCRCDCGAIYKNALLLKFHKNDCMTTYVKQGVSRISKVKEKLASLQN